MVRIRIVFPDGMEACSTIRKADIDKHIEKMVAIYGQIAYWKIENEWEVKNGTL